MSHVIDFRLIEKMENTEVEKSRILISTGIIEYVPNSVVIKVILNKVTGNIRVLSLDAVEAFSEKIIPYDKFIQIIEGKAEIIIDGISNLLDTGQSIVIPAHASNSFTASDRFKMISTVIKSGYE